MEFVTAEMMTGKIAQRGHGQDSFQRAVPASVVRGRSPYGNRLEQASLLYEGRHNRNDGDVTMPELNFAGLRGAPRGFLGALGQDVITAIREAAESARPALDFVGAHPWMTLTLLLSAIIAGGAAGGYIGAGFRSSKA